MDEFVQKLRKGGGENGIGGLGGGAAFVRIYYLDFFFALTGKLVRGVR